jgi:proline racemase
MAILHKLGKIGIGDKLTAISIIDSEFTGQILGITKVGNMDAILPEISGRAWITGTHQHMLDPSDPWPGGYRISDTWGV